MFEDLEKRRALTSAAASALLPGLGQIYNGERGLGLALFVGFAFSVPLTSWLALQAPAEMLYIIALAGVALSFGLYIYAVASAYRCGRRPVAVKLSDTAGFFAVAVLVYFAVLYPLMGYTRRHLLASYRVPTPSMEPTILPGDRMFVASGEETLKRGALIVLISPNDRSRRYVKRIVGLPGDSIEIHSQQLLVNGRTVTGDAEGGNRRETIDENSYQVIWQKPSAELAIKVPPGHVFVLGDNRDNSMDSRTFGSVPLQDLIGQPRQIIFSAHNGMRWSRIGRILK